MDNTVLMEYRDSDLYAHHTRTEKPDPENFTFHNHSHNMFEVYLFLAGEADYVVEGHIYALCRGMVIFTALGQTHHLRLKSAAPYERVALLFDQRLLPAGFEKLIERAKTGESGFLLAPEALDSVLKNLALADRAPEKRQGLLAALYLLLTEINDEITEPREAPYVTDEAVAGVIACVTRHLTEPIDLALIEKECFLNRSYLERRFRHVMGCSIWQYIIRKRVFHARQQLVITRDIGKSFSLSGFNDYSAFYRAYKKVIGLSPTEDLKRING